MMLRYSLGHGEQADLIEKAVTKVLDGPELGGFDMRTGDLKGSASTSDIGDKVVEVLEGMLKK
jgi:3-isopropylmalate dehydrogenase